MSAGGNTNRAKDALVSVIVPVFNDERFIGDCLSSLRSQTGVNYEVLIVLDTGSVDKSAEAVTPWSQVAGFRLISTPHCTIGRALNVGLRNAEGDVIAFAEADKVFDAGWLKNALDYFHEHPDVVGVGSLAIPPQTKSFAGNCLKEMKEINQRRLRNARDIEWGYVYRRETLERVGGWNEELLVAEDRDLARRVIKAGGKIHLVKKTDNIHHLSGIYDGLLPLLRKQYATGTKHTFNHVRSFTAGWMLSALTAVGLIAIVASLFMPALLLPGVVLVLSEYTFRLAKFAYISRGRASVRIIFLPLLATAMNMAYAGGLFMGMRPFRKDA